MLGQRVSGGYVPLPSSVADGLGHPRVRSQDLAALVYRSVGGILLALLTILVPLGCLNAAVIPFYWWALPPGDSTGTVFEVNSWWSAAASGGLGIGGLALVLAAPAIAEADARITSALLAPSHEEELHARVRVEEHRRRSAVSAHTAELRRIERDLHDAAQNRLVAVAMFIGMAQRQLATGGTEMSTALAKADLAASDALADVRRVIRGIYPPTLTEQGLVPALGLLVDRLPIRARLRVEHPAPSPPSVDAALYFSVAETLTNVAKHSGATECDVHLNWYHRDHGPWVSATVTDNGTGGANSAKGSGLAGVESRLDALGGWFEVSSPAGGPTQIRMNLPCES